MSAAVKILEWKPRSSGALRGFADVEHAVHPEVLA
jgi:hypothetical protein